MESLAAHLEILREILTENATLPFRELAEKIEARAAQRGVKTTRIVIARLVLGATANVEACREAFPEVPPLVTLLANGRYKLKV